MHLPKTSTPKVPWPDQGGWCNFSDDTGKNGGVPLLMDRHTAKNASSRREITQMTGPRIFVLCDQEAKPRDWFYQIVKLRNITHSQRLNGVPLNLLIWHELAERFWNSFIRAKFESSINKYNAAFWFITRENINFDSIDTHTPPTGQGGSQFATITKCSLSEVSVQTKSPRTGFNWPAANFKWPTYYARSGFSEVVRPSL